MSIIINRKPQTNQWSHLPDDAPLTAGDVTVSLSRRLGGGDDFERHNGRIGIRLQPGDDVEDAAPFIDGLPLIAVEFDKFTEGRGYSQAYLLRERYGFSGELRAIGARRDHVMYMERCGFNAFEPAPPDDAESLIQGFDDIDVRYQPSHDRVPLIFRKRARRTPNNLTENSA